MKRHQVTKRTATMVTATTIQIVNQMLMKATMAIMKKEKKKKMRILILKLPANLQVKYGNKMEVKRHSDVINNDVISHQCVTAPKRERKKYTLVAVMTS